MSEGDAAAGNPRGSANQDDVLQRWTTLAGSEFAAAARRDWESQWRSLASHGSPELQQLATMLFDTGQQYLSLLGNVVARESARDAAATGGAKAAAPQAEHPRAASAEGGGGAQGAEAAPFAELLHAWSKGLFGGTEAPRVPANMAKFAEFLGQLPGLAYGRGFREALRELATAEGELQRLVKDMSAALTAAQTESLQLLETRLRERAAAGQAIDSYRALYDVWVTCSELAYSKLAHSEAFGKQQAALSDASIRVRVQQQRVLDLVLKHFDLPTRTEINALHRQIRDQRERLARIEGATATSQAAADAPISSKSAKSAKSAKPKRARPAKAAPKKKPR